MFSLPDAAPFGFASNVGVAGVHSSSTSFSSSTGVTVNECSVLESSAIREQNLEAWGGGGVAMNSHHTFTFGENLPPGSFAVTDCVAFITLRSRFDVTAGESTNA